MSGTSLINAIVGEYRIIDRIGAGGMGEVYKAAHSKIGRLAAIKFLHSSVAGAQFVERFLNEARIQASLQHPNIATLYDFLEYNRQPCIIMEYIEGQTLSEYIRSRGCLPVAETLRLFHDIVDAISYIHNQGIIHRDIKSSNVKITPSGQIKLLDFGIAKSGGSPSLTMTGGFVGTLQYISPEQFTGGIADQRADIWALGVLLYEMVTCHMPFDAPSIGGLYQQINAAVYQPPSIYVAQAPREIESVIARCLRKNPDERYQSGWQLLQDVNRLLARPSSPASEAPTIVTPPAPAPAPYQYQNPHQYQNPQTVGNAAYPTHPSGGMATASPSPPAKSKAKIVLISSVAAGVLAIGSAGVYMMSGNGGTQPTANNISRNTNTRSSGLSVASQTYTIELSDGRAEVFKDGQKIGATPYKFEGKPGEHMDFMLKREGFNDKPVRIMLGANQKVFTYTMDKKY